MPDARPLCAHCLTTPVNRPRGLCWSCYYTPGVRDLYGSARPSSRRGVGSGDGDGLAACWACNRPTPSHNRDRCPGWAARDVQHAGSNGAWVEWYCPACFAAWGWPPLPAGWETKSAAAARIAAGIPPAPDLATHGPAAPVPRVARAEVAVRCHAPADRAW